MPRLSNLANREKYLAQSAQISSKLSSISSNIGYNSQISNASHVNETRFSTIDIYDIPTILLNKLPTQEIQISKLHSSWQSSPKRIFKENLEKK